MAAFSFSTSGLYRSLAVAFPLAVLNYLSNFFFLGRLGFYSDDWVYLLMPYRADQSYGTILLDSQRPLAEAVFKFQSRLLLDDPLVYHVLGFITTTLMLLLIYAILRRMLAEFGYDDARFAFIATSLYAVLPNKDELYPLAIFGLGIFFLLFLISWYTYLRRDLGWALPVSLGSYFLGLLSYEIGIGLPAVYLVHDLLAGRDWKRSALFAVPLGAYLLIRATVWFGFGTTAVDRGFGYWNPVELAGAIVLALFEFAYFTVANIEYGICAFLGLETPTLALLLALNLAAAALLARCARCGGPGRQDAGVVIFAAVAVAAFFTPYFLVGGLSPRHAVFIDIGIAVLLALAVCRIAACRRTLCRGCFFLLFFACLVVSQGLMANWVASGDFQYGMYESVGLHHDEIAQYPVVYYNQTDLSVHFRHDLEYRAVDHVYLEMGIGRIPSLGFYTDRKIARAHRADGSRYYNTHGLSTVGLRAMLKKHGIDPSRLAVSDTSLPVPGEDGGLLHLVFLNGTTVIMDPDDCYEIDYSFFAPRMLARAG